MANWYRHPKSLNLRWLIRDSRFSFVLNASQFSEGDVQQLRACLSAMELPRRICLGTTLAGNATSILIVSTYAVQEEDLKLLLSNGWRGIVAVPPGVRVATGKVHSVTAIDIRPAHTPMAVEKYILKGLHPTLARTFNIDHIPQGWVTGKRIGHSKNIGPVQVAEMRRQGVYPPARRWIPYKTSPRWRLLCPSGRAGVKDDYAQGGPKATRPECFVYRIP